MINSGQSNDEIIPKDLHVTLQLTNFIADEDEVLMHAGRTMVTLLVYDRFLPHQNLAIPAKI